MFFQFIENVKVLLNFEIENTKEKMVNKTFNIIVEKGVDGYLLSSVVELPGCHTQAKSYDDLYARTKEAIELYLDEDK